MKETVAAARRKMLHSSGSLSIAMVLIIAVGVAGSIFAGISEYRHLRDSLLGRAAVVADALLPEDIMQLQGSSSDVTNPAYTRIKLRLEQIISHTHDIRFVYLLGQRDNNVIFLADSELPSSTFYSPPGQTYHEATDTIVHTFSSETATLEGPDRDRWGAWMSGLAPIIDPNSGQTIAVAGIDMPVFNFYLDVAVYALIPLILAAIPLAGLIRDRKVRQKEFEIVELKDQFVSIASHELRSPLNGMLWAIQTLLKSGAKNMKRAQIDMLTDMYRSTASSIATVNEILDLSIFTQGKTHHMQRDRIDLTSVIGEIYKTQKLGAAERKVKLVIKNIPEHIFVLGELGPLKRAIMNIVSNAIKYTNEHTEVTLEYSLVDGHHLLTISDQGIGIPKEEQAKIFEGYYRASNATRREAQGTGLGLWVTRLAIENHGGKIWLKSDENKGTSVYIQLPDYAEAIANLKALERQ